MNRNDQNTAMDKIWENLAPRVPFTMDIIRYCERYMNHPDYTKDLNAVHEIEMQLDRVSKHYDFCLALMKVCRVRTFDRCMSATAAQRTEAILRVFNLWCVDMAVKITPADEVFYDDLDDAQPA